MAPHLRQYGAAARRLNNDQPQTESLLEVLPTGAAMSAVQPSTQLLTPVARSRCPSAASADSAPWTNNDRRCGAMTGSDMPLRHGRSLLKLLRTLPAEPLTGSLPA
ncbi:hypothetical protein ACN47E_008209 [Coniothyrium glycines]